MKNVSVVMVSIAAALMLILPQTASAQEHKKVFYDDSANPIEQIDNAIAQAAATGRYAICQVGGNWCSWCILFGNFISQNEKIKSVIDDNFIYSHINVYKKNAKTGKNEVNTEAMAKLGNPERFGYPVMVVLDGKGNVLHIQDSSFLEEGRGYNESKVLRFFNNWTPKAAAR